MTDGCGLLKRARSFRSRPFISIYPVIFLIGSGSLLRAGVRDQRIDFAAAQQAYQRGQGDHCNGQYQQGLADAAAPQDGGVAIADGEGAAQVLLQHFTQHKAQNEWRHGEVHLAQQVAKDPEAHHQQQIEGGAVHRIDTHGRDAGDGGH